MVEDSDCPVAVAEVLIFCSSDKYLICSVAVVKVLVCLVVLTEVLVCPEAEVFDCSVTVSEVL